MVDTLLHDSQILNRLALCGHRSG